MDQWIDGSRDRGSDGPGGWWEYPHDFVDALAVFGLRPTRGTPPRVVRDALNDLYRYEIRRLRDRHLAGHVARADYVPAVIELRKKYWPLAVQPDGWDRLIRYVPAPSAGPPAGSSA